MSDVERIDTLIAQVQLPATVQIPELTQFDLTRLAREISMSINELETILGHFGLSETQFEQIKQNEFFQRTLENYITEWNSATNTPTRIKIEAAAMFEQAMPMLYRRMSNEQENLNQVVEAGKLIARVAGIGEKAEAGLATGEKFSIVINLGDKQITKDVTPVTIDVDQTAAI